MCLELLHKVDATCQTEPDVPDLQVCVSFSMLRTMFWSLSRSVSINVTLSVSILRGCCTNWMPHVGLNLTFRIKRVVSFSTLSLFLYLVALSPSFSAAVLLWIHLFRDEDPEFFPRIRIRLSWKKIPDPDPTPDPTWNRNEEKNIFIF